MPKLKIKRYPEENELSEIYQKVDIRFSFLSSPANGCKQCHQLAKCRDFLHDAVNAEVNKDKSSIYGFVYRSGKNPPIDLRRMRMLVMKGKEKVEEFDSSMKKAKILLQHYERLANWRKSRLLKVDGEPNMRLFVGPLNWMKCSFLVSMYTLLIRLGAKDIGKFGSNEELVAIYRKIKELDSSGSDNDVIYLRNCFDKLDLVVKYAPSLFSKRTADNYPSKTKVDLKYFHNCGGILSLCTFVTYDKELNAKFKEIYEKETQSQKEERQK